MKNQENKSNMPVDVIEAINNYLSLSDQYLPGKINGLYIVGSIALHDYQSQKSDIDFVTVSNKHFSEKELSLLSSIHNKIRKSNKYPKFDGIYVTWDELKTTPDAVSAPFCLDNKFRKANGFAANPVTWYTLLKYPLSFRGPEKPQVYNNPNELRNWCKTNLNTYWKKWVINSRRNPIRILYSFSPAAICWGVLGIIRLYATIATGDIVSKSKAFEYAINKFPKEWGEIITIALKERISNSNNLIFNPLIHNPFVLRKRALHFMEYIIDESNKIKIG